jgi:hypothetical protein
VYDKVTVTLPPVGHPAGGLAPAELRAVGRWIGLNEAAIRAHWDGTISSVEFARRLCKLP